MTKTPNKIDAKVVEPAGEQTEESEVTLEAEVSEKETKAAKTSESDSSSEEKKPSTEEVVETSETPETVKEEEVESLTDEERKNLSDKAQKRYRHLNEKSRKAEERAAELEEQVEKLRTAQEEKFVGGIKPVSTGTPATPQTKAVSQDKLGSPTTENLPWEPKASGEVREITEEDYKREVIQTADYIVRARLGQYEKSNQIKADLKDVESKYSELNPDSPEYSEEMSDKLSNLFKTQLHSDPNVRLKAFVNDIMSLRKSGEEKGKSEVTAKVVEQKAEEAVTPSEIAPPEDSSFEDMTLKEKEQYMKGHGLW